MATVPTLRTWTDGEVITHTMFNENFRDTTEFMVNDKPHGFARQLVSTTSVPINTWTPIAWDFEDVDTDGSFASPSTTFYNVNTAGFYMVTGHINWEANTNGVRQAKISYSVGGGGRINIRGAYVSTPPTSVATGTVVTVMDHFDVNDRIYLEGRQTAVDPLSTNLNYANFRNETSFLDVAWWGKAP